MAITDIFPAQLNQQKREITLQFFVAWRFV
jgi:hypothetical protein